MLVDWVTEAMESETMNKWGLLYYILEVVWKKSVLAHWGHSLWDLGGEGELTDKRGKNIPLSPWERQCARTSEVQSTPPEEGICSNKWQKHDWGHDGSKGLHLETTGFEEVATKDSVVAALDPDFPPEMSLWWYKSQMEKYTLYPLIKD